VTRARYWHRRAVIGYAGWMRGDGESGANAKSPGALSNFAKQDRPVRKRTIIHSPTSLSDNTTGDFSIAPLVHQPPNFRGKLDRFPLLFMPFSRY
jgi:hypothetical protein